ncbi:unnamed protein product [Ixodes pacificus]
MSKIKFRTGSIQHLGRLTGLEICGTCIESNMQRESITTTPTTLANVSEIKCL